MLEYLHASNFTAAYNALKADARSEYTPDPKAKYAGLLEKKWTSVIRLQKKVHKFRYSYHLWAPEFIKLFSLHVT